MSLAAANDHQFTYTSQIVGVMAMAFSKASVSLLLRRLSVYQSSPCHSSVPVVAVGIYTIFSFFTSIFQCGLPSPWRVDVESCPYREGLWITTISLNILSDAILSVYVIPGIWKLNMAKAVRLTVVSLFMSRVIVCVSAAIELVRLIQNNGSKDDTCQFPRGDV